MATTQQPNNSKRNTSKHFVWHSVDSVFCYLLYSLPYLEIVFGYVVPFFFFPAERLETFAIIGEMDELLPLASEPLASLQFNLQWFKDLEQAMKDTMMKALSDCVRFRFEGNF